MFALFFVSSVRLLIQVVRVIQKREVYKVVDDYLLWAVLTTAIPESSLSKT